VNVNIRTDLERLLSPEPIIVDLSDFSAPAETFLRALLVLFDACPSSPPRSAPQIVTFDRLAALSAEQLRTLRAATLNDPLFICPGRNAGTTIDTAALAAIAGMELSASDPHSVSRYAFAQTGELWPFSGMSLAEARRQTVPAFRGASRSVVPLVSAEHGDVFLKIERGKGIYITTVPLPDAPENRLLKNEIEPTKFIALLPIIFFLRTALRERGWRTPSLGATFIVDDPNLRRARYGFLDLRRLVDESIQHDFHTSLAMIPLDYRKTRRSVADLVARHPDRLSLVIHGVDHLRREFEAPVTNGVAETVLAQGLARMEAHERHTGLRHARALTFPHGRCNETWMTAMRNVGFDAAIVSRSFPFRAEAEIDDPLYELYPAQMTFLGFPVINRFQAEAPKERLLFQALLGKPLIIYTHHAFYKDGLERAREIVDFVNRHVLPRWESADAIVRSNYQLKHRQGQTLVRIFSNRISIRTDTGSPQVVVKPGRGFPTDEVCRTAGDVVEPVRTAAGLVVVLPTPNDGLREVAFGPADPIRHPVRRASVPSRVRRLGTELRDQLALPVVSSAVDVGERIGRRFR
jgi:hypothetical protein